MIILKEFNFLQKLLGLNPLGGFENTIVRLIYLSSLTPGLLALSIFFISNARDDVFRAFKAMPSIVGFTLLLANYWHLLVYRERFYALVDDLRDIVDERRGKTENGSVYAKAEQQNSSATRIIIYGSLSIAVCSLSPFPLAAYHWCLDKYTLKSWIFFLPIWTPFELNTTLRCASVVLYETVCTTCDVFILCSVPGLLIAFMIYSKACLLDIKSLFNRVDELSQLGNFQKSTPKNHNMFPCKNSEWKMLELCKEAVDLHRKINRLLHSLADAMNVIISETVLLWAMCVCSALLAIEKYNGNNIFIDLQISLLASVFPLVLLAIMFFLGQNFHSNMVELSNTIYDTEWYQYPRSVQRFVLLMMMRSQQPFYLSANGIMSLELGNFVSLLRRMYSAYMVLRSMN